MNLVTEALKLNMLRSAHPPPHTLQVQTLRSSDTFARTLERHWGTPDIGRFVGRNDFRPGYGFINDGGNMAVWTFDLTK